MHNSIIVITVKSVTWITITGSFISLIKSNISYIDGNLLQNETAITLPDKQPANAFPLLDKLTGLLNA